MVDPASGSGRSHQQPQPPALSITVTPLAVTENIANAVADISPLSIGPLSEELINEATRYLFDDIVDDIILGVVFEVHRGIKVGLTALLEDGLTGDSQCDFDADETTRSSGGIPVTVEEENAEIFTSSLAKKPAECVCPNCQRNMAASRFAPHLEKCMGMGRNSSRLASRRIASATREAAMISDDDVEDDEWASGNGTSCDKRKRHNKKDKNSPRRKKLKNGDSSNSSSCVSLVAAVAAGTGSAAEMAVLGDVSGMETLPLIERRNILSTMCGVVSEHTGRMCTRSLRCPQHSDTQRKGVREVMLGQDGDNDSIPLTCDPGDKEKEIDVDTWEEGDSLASLLTAQVQSQEIQTATAEASPAESTSTSTSSTSSRRRESKSSKNKKKVKNDN